MTKQVKETCPGCGEEKELHFHAWVIKPSPSSGISEPGVWVCDECAAIGEAYDHD
ncbi:hypothetical protein J25TS5_04250 [Paenibacillus faecis]|nr:hypothetical protein J25TS5_04250 [Paenibacillus faecis]